MIDEYFFFHSIEYLFLTLPSSLEAGNVKIGIATLVNHPNGVPSSFVPPNSSFRGVPVRRPTARVGDSRAEMRSMRPGVVAGQRSPFVSRE